MNLNRKRISRLSLSLLSVFSAIFLIIYLNIIPNLLPHVLNYIVNRSGLVVVNISQAQISPHHLVLHDIVVHPKDFDYPVHFQEINFTYRLTSKGIHISGIDCWDPEIKINRASNDQIAFPSLQNFDFTPPSYLFLPSHLSIHHAQIEGDGLSLNIEGSFPLTKEEKHDYEITWNVSYPNYEGHGEVIVQGVENNISFSSHIPEFKIHKNDFSLTLEDLEVLENNNNIDAHGTLKSIHEKNFVPIHGPSFNMIPIPFSLTIEKNDHGYSGHLQGTMSGIPLLYGTLLIDNAFEKAQLMLDSQTLDHEFIKTYFYLPKNVFKTHQILAGKFNLKTKSLIDLKNNIYDTSFETTIHEGHFKNKTIELLGINTTLKGTLAPLTVSPCAFNISSVTLEEFFLKDFKGNISSNTNEFLLDHVTGNTLGGKFEIEPFDLESLEDGFTVNIHFQDIHLKKLIRLLDIREISGNGFLNGEIELYIDTLTTDLKSANITSNGHGNFRYQGLVPTVDDPNQNFNALRALEDLNYKTFHMDIYPSPSLKNELESKITVIGSNPKILNGQPFHFNISAKGDLKDLVKNTLDTLKPEMQFEKLKEKFEKGK